MAHVIAELLKDDLQIELTYGQATNITLGYEYTYSEMCDMCGVCDVCRSVCVSGAHAVARTLIRMAPPSPAPCLYGNDDLEKAEVNPPGSRDGHVTVT